jgi:hypothetical protein
LEMNSPRGGGLSSVNSQEFLAATLQIPASALSNVSDLYLQLYNSSMPGGRMARNYYEAMRALPLEDAVRMEAARSLSVSKNSCGAFELR